MNISCYLKILLHKIHVQLIYCSLKTYGCILRLFLLELSFLYNSKLYIRIYIQFLENLYI